MSIHNVASKYDEGVYLIRKERMRRFYQSKKLKGVLRVLSDDEWFDSIFSKR